MLSRRNWR